VLGRLLLGGLLLAAAWLVQGSLGGRVPVLASEGAAASPPLFELPFPIGERWVVVAPAADRGPSRADAWSASFTLADSEEGLVTTPASGTVRVLSIDPPFLPAWCAPTARWHGPQLEIQIRTTDGSIVALTNVSALLVGTGDKVETGQVIGHLGTGECDGRRALQLVRWAWIDGRLVSRPFGVLSGYRDEDLVPGGVVTRDPPRMADQPTPAVLGPERHTG
jgi:hypothetical protein